MEAMQRHYSLLLVSSSEKFNSSLLPIIPESRYGPVTVSSDSADASRLLLEKNFDIVIINTPLKDEFGTALALNVCEGSGTGVMLFVKSEHFSEIEARVSPYGILTISKPAPASIINQSLALICGTRERLRRMEKKTASIEEKMEEIRLVNRAKWLLIGQLKMTETEAHRYIEKQAMDRCVTRREIAESILSTYK